MKYLTLLLLLSCGQVVAQKSPAKKKEFQWPKPVKDTSWITVSSDTLYGTIEYNFGGGKVTGEGMIVKDQFWHHSEYIYSERDRKKIDSFQSVYRGQGGMWASDRGGYSMSTEDQKRAYIKTTNGWKFVEEKFTFKPKQ